MSQPNTPARCGQGHLPAQQTQLQDPAPQWKKPPRNEKALAFSFPLQDKVVQSKYEGAKIQLNFYSWSRRERWMPGVNHQA